MTTKISSTVIAFVLGTTLVAAACTRQSTPGESQIALVTIPAARGARLTVTTPAFAPDGDIPFENTQYRGNVFPGLSWSAGPAGTKSYAVIMQDADAIVSGEPILHWTMVNIPANVTKLDSAMKAPPAGAQYGPNIRGASQAYMGPHTPPGPKHHYHFQVFALDISIPSEPTLEYGALTSAMKGHVLASGEVVGLGQAPPSGT